MDRKEETVSRGALPSSLRSDPTEPHFAGWSEIVAALRAPSFQQDSQWHNPKANYATKPRELLSQAADTISDLAGLAFEWRRRTEEVTTGWRPIDTAPLDGSHILLFGRQQPHGEVHIAGRIALSGYWEASDGEWCSTGSTWDGPFYDCTHWMPLPSVPEEQA